MLASLIMKHNLRFWLVRASVSRTGVRLGVPEAGPLTFQGQGGAGLTLFDLGVPQGGTPKAPETAGRVGLESLIFMQPR